MASATDWKDTLAALSNSGNIPEATDNISDNQQDSPKNNNDSQCNPLNIVFERKGRKGKPATIIEGFNIPDSEVDNIARKLKQKIGVGGSSRGGEILLQGDWRNKAYELLREMGFRVKGGK